MLPRYLRPQAVFDGQSLRSDVVLQLSPEGRVSLNPEPPEGAKIEALAGVVSHGLVDLQVNGGGGVMLNDQPNGAGMAVIAQAHRRLGTVRLLPTLITDCAEKAQALVDALLGAPLPAAILGVHFEGPHIAPARRGTHRAADIRPFERQSLQQCARLRAAGIAVMVTLAPEQVALEDIAALAALGVVVSIGHSDATAAQVEAALQAGARNFTHLFNAMSQMQGREPGVVGAAILSDADIGFICDGHHVAPDMLRLALKAHGAARAHLVSDAMATVGGGPSFSLYGQEIRVEGGRLINAEGNLAGAHVSLADCVLNACRLLGLSGAQALHMAISNPARVMGFDFDLAQGAWLQDLILWPDGEAVGAAWRPKQLPQLLEAVLAEGGLTRSA